MSEYYQVAEPCELRTPSAGTGCRSRSRCWRCHRCYVCQCGCRPYRDPLTPSATAADV